MARPVEMPAASDQARIPIFRGLLVVQVLAAGFFGLVPFVAPETFAAWFGLDPQPVVIYRFAGAASLGYAAMAIAGLVQPSWYTLRLATVATFGFNIGAVVASVLAIANGESKALIVFILVAGTAFAAIAAYWLARNQGPDPLTAWPITPLFWAVLLLATIAALTFGLAPLFVPGTFASVGGLPEGEPYIYRLAGAAAFGYALAGIYELRAAEEIGLRVPVIGALSFNALSAIAAAVYLAQGGTAVVGWVVLVAATLFSVAFGYWLTVTGSVLRG